MNNSLFNLRFQQQDLLDELNWEKERLEEYYFKLRFAISSRNSELISSLKATIDIAEKYIQELEEGLTIVENKISSLQTK